MTSFPKRLRIDIRDEDYYVDSSGLSDKTIRSLALFGLKVKLKNAAAGHPCEAIDRVIKQRMELLRRSGD